MVIRVTEGTEERQKNLEKAGTKEIKSRRKDRKNYDDDYNYG